MKPNSNPIDSVRSRLTGKSGSGPGSRPRRSRSDQEAQYQRSFRLAMIGVAALIIVILAGGIVYEYVIKPNQVLAQVNGHEIRRRDYWKYQSVALYQQARTYEAYASQSQADQQQQFLQFAASFDAQRADVWGSTDVSPTTLQQMVNDQLYLDGAASMGIEMSDNDIQTFALNQFAPQEAPLQTPIPAPTMIPERAEMATQAAEDQATQQAIALGTVVASPVAEGTPGATPIADGATPVSDATPMASPAAATPVSDEAAATPGASPVATMSLDDSLNTASAEYQIFQDDVFGDAHMSEDDYIRLWVTPRFAREQVNARIVADVPQVADQVNAQHIMVTTEDLANQLYDQVTNGADFSAIAVSNSTDTTTASTGGQLGWFAPFDVSDTFGQQAFALQPGQTSAPFQDGANWHIIRVNERQDARPLTDAQYTTATNNALDTWIKDQQANADISSDDLTTPTPTAEAFVAPPGAPTPIPPTPVPPTPTPPIIGPELATPIAGAATPVATGGTPGASPVVDTATPVAGTPDVVAVGATPAASTPVVASPVASPAATPAATPEGTPAG